MIARTRESLRDGIFAASFSPAPATTGVGVEVELLAYDAATDFPKALLGNANALVPLIRRHAERAGWRERPGYGDVPCFDVPGTATISFEPGGQIEISTLPRPRVTDVVRSARDVVERLRGALQDHGVRLDSVGIDPFNDARSIPLQLRVERYERMTRYFERLSPYGIRMMRQTAAIQVSLDRGEAPPERWRLLNDLAPYVTAIFANSRHYCRTDTGHQSFRAGCWRMLDPTRTGVAATCNDPAGAYADFALAANDILRSADGQAVPFSALAQEPNADVAWQKHLTTLFPEVRPRGHYEVRSCDAIDVAWYAAPIVFLYGLAYDKRSASEASILAAESGVLLRAAGEQGLRDVSIARTSRDLFQLALDGARRLGPARVGPEELETATEFFRAYTARDRCPADDRTLAVPTSHETVEDLDARLR